MASIEAAMFGRDLRQLFDGRGVVGLTEAQLVDRIARRDESAEAAFEAILTRHGPAVLACCRRVLGDAAAAEDAFQATFLVLYRRAGSIRVAESLAPWLLHVARMAALKARQGELRRLARERRVARPELTDRRGAVVRPPPAGARRGRSLAREVPRAGPPVLLRGPDSRRRGRGPRLAGRDGPRAALAGPGHAPHAVDATGHRHHAGGAGRGDGRGRRRPGRGPAGPPRGDARGRVPRRGGRGRGRSRWRRRSYAAWPFRRPSRRSAIVLAVVSMISAGAGFAALAGRESHARTLSTKPPRAARAARRHGVDRNEL